MNLTRFQKFLNHLCDIDLEKFNETYANLRYFEEKIGRKATETEILSDYLRKSVTDKKIRLILKESIVVREVCTHAQVNTCELTLVLLVARM